MSTVGARIWIPSTKEQIPDSEQGTVPGAVRPARRVLFILAKTL